MYWDNADNFTFGYLFIENNVTSLLLYLHESQPFQERMVSSAVARRSFGIFDLKNRHKRRTPALGTAFLKIQFRGFLEIR